MERSSHDGGFFRNEEELFAAIEREVGSEAAQAARRSRQLTRNPRPLTDAEGADLRAALDPVLRDLRTTDAIVPDVVEEAREDLGLDCVPAWIQPPGTAGSLVAGSQGIRVLLSLPVPERLADLAEQLQEWEVEELAAAGRPATWPECPQHPDSHPLAAQAHGDQAVWCCPRSGQVIAVIGALPPG